jgi:hypothetical protein
MLDVKMIWQGLWGVKTKVRSQLVLMATEDGRIKPQELDVLRVCCVDKASESAYLMDSANQFRNPLDGKWYQLLGERSTIPICLLRETNVKNLRLLINGLYKESKEVTKAKKYREAKENPVFNQFRTLAFIVICALAVVLIKRNW